MIWPCLAQSCLSPLRHEEKRGIEPLDEVYKEVALVVMGLLWVTQLTVGRGKQSTELTHWSYQFRRCRAQGLDAYGHARNPTYTIHYR